MINPEFIPHKASPEEEKKIFEDNVNAGLTFKDIEDESEDFIDALKIEDGKNSSKTKQMEEMAEFSKIKVEQNININNQEIEKIESELINEYGHNKNDLDEKTVFAERADRRNDQGFIARYNDIHYTRSQLLDANKKLREKLEINEHPNSN